MKKNENLGIVITAFTLQALANQYPMQITAEQKGTKAEIKLSGAIYDWQNSSQEITQKIDGFMSEGITDVEVYINSPGGDVFQSAEISNQIKRFTGIKKGFGGAIVASSAADIAVSLDSFEMAENGQFMYHKPSANLSGNEDKIETSLVLLKNLTSQYKVRLSEKSGLTVEEIEANWTKGDVWLTAQEALEQKFITGVITKTVITPETKAMVEACGSPNAPNVTANQNPKNEVDKTKEIEIKAIVNQLVYEKKINGLQVVSVENMFKANFDDTLKYFEVKPAPKKISDLINITGTSKGRESWTLNDWREKAPLELKANPDFYAELVKKEFNQ
ncbi:MAG: Clp protease ClpP [Flavobacterium sp.]|nr:Clp protease ClpP [Flavobacterium sp.]